MMESDISNAKVSSASKNASESDRTASDSPTKLGGREKQGLEQENAELLRVSRYRSLFLARLAHELRTPLTSILGFSEILLNQEKLTVAQRSFCERIQSSAHQLQNSLNQLSDLARLEAGQAKLACEEVSLGEILRESVSAVARRAQKKHVTVTCDVDGALPSMTSDRARLRTVVYNVLAYAIARSPEGQAVKVSAQVNAEDAEVIVQDEGEPLASPLEIGMLEEDNDKAGTGELGLAIARQNIQSLGGTISASNRDVGLEMKITLPLSAPREL
jgi:signal transduction histidine kinase